jgi:hypothetical protein
MTRRGLDRLSLGCSEAGSTQRTPRAHRDAFGLPSLRPLRSLAVGSGYTVLKTAIGRLILAVIMSGTATAAAFAQGEPTTRLPDKATLEFIGGEIGFGAVVRGAPFSGEGVTTVSQTLGDGTRIERRTTARVYRDNEGRVRREQTVLGLDVLKSSSDGQPIITISDPVAGVTWVLDTGSRTARRSRPGLKWSTGRGVVSIDGVPPLPPPPPPGEPPVRRPLNLPNAPEPLGTRQMEGVTVNGTRRVETIPAGQIGNDRPITITDERWESPELKVLVSSQHHDPRTGDVEYRLTNISRAEPPAHLFTVPADYEIVDMPPPPGIRN